MFGGWETSVGSLWKGDSHTNSPWFKLAILIFNDLQFIQTYKNLVLSNMFWDQPLPSPFRTHRSKMESWPRILCIIVMYSSTVTISLAVPWLCWYGSHVCGRWVGGSSAHPHGYSSSGCIHITQRGDDNGDDVTIHHTFLYVHILYTPSTHTALQYHWYHPWFTLLPRSF